MELMVLILSAVLLALVFVVCGTKGFRLLFSLLLTMAVLIGVVTPLIVHGLSPELVVVVVGLVLLACIIYLSEGFNALSHLSFVAVALNFLFISAVVHFSVSLAHLTGITSADDSFLGLTGINLPQLLSAGIMLGTLGILTEMVVTQVATVVELMLANPEASRAQLYKNAYAVGTAHLGSIINTLFLVYAGVSFPLLIIYAGGGSSLTDALNYEPLVGEILRTLVGTIGLIIAMPTSTWLAARWLKK